MMPVEGSLVGNEKYHIGTFSNQNNIPSKKFFLWDGLLRIPVGILLTVVALSFLGLMVLFSISGHYFVRQLSFSVFGFFIAISLSAINPRYFVRYAYLMHGVSVLLLIFVLVSGDRAMGARRWIDVGLFRFQPSEIAKITLVLAIARYYHFSSSDGALMLKNAIIPVFLIVLTSVLVFKQPDLGSSIIIFIIGVSVLFVSGLKIRHFVIAAICASLALPLVWGQMRPYQKRRIMTFISPGEDSLGSGYNIMQSKITIGSGGLFGRGLQNSSQSSLGFLPESHTDFIFSVFTEEFGFAGFVLFLLLVGILMYFFYSIARSSSNQFFKVLITGIAIVFYVHIFVNLGMISGILPVVGSPIPFFSYGGTFVLTVFFSLGLAFNISAYRNLEISASSQTYMHR